MKHGLPLLLISDGPIDETPFIDTTVLDASLVIRSRGDLLLQQIADNSYALVLIHATDLTPEVLDCCKTIRSRFVSPILVLTESNDESLQVQAYLSGVDECIVKPIGTELLTAKVAAWLRWRKRS